MEEYSAMHNCLREMTLYEAKKNPFQVVSSAGRPAISTFFFKKSKKI